ncbi:hypothetical protein [uncultured Massilia sp.]|uniref:hypothetical protein n=1 Tax=uncultured Massilia sp. TaxID=169973 RepID=UPI00258BBE33|nr:hypothetical protein [uncultured Massilia sp.]
MFQQRALGVAFLDRRLQSGQLGRFAFARQACLFFLGGGAGQRGLGGGLFGGQARGGGVGGAGIGLRLLALGFQLALDLGQRFARRLGAGPFGGDGRLQ